MVFAACETAKTFASDICAASSINKTSTHSNASGRAQNHAVAPATWQFVPIADKSSALSVSELQPVEGCLSISEGF